jgi:Nucleotide modification associated domain 2
MSGVRLCSYRLTTDAGFAPNPFFGMLTLATSMPEVRQSSAVDDWIAGFTSSNLCGDAIGAERLVYLMRVEERPTIAEYFADDRFARKIPSLNGAPEVERHGDNIYQPRRADAAEPAHFEQLSNPHHWDQVHDREDLHSKRRDVSGRRVLVTREFVYFGREALPVADFARPVLPKRLSRCCAVTTDADLARAFIDFAFGKAARPVVAPPHAWPAGDGSWRR